ncbi:MAG: exodeoxyribonuclease III [Bdellovibrio sp.]|nr:MAG: exodeoxyribonuclease III [Bdellovibrio sp.]
MKIISWNVNGIRACAKKGLLKFIEKEDPDILCLQETKAHPEQLPEELVHPLGRKGFFSSAHRRGYSGTATFVKPSYEPLDVSYGIQIKKFDSEGRFVITRFPQYVVYNVYFPNGSASEERHFFKMHFLHRFLAHLKKQIKKGEKIILCGDYNIAHKEADVFDPVRLSSHSGFLPEERAWFDRFLEAGFVDVFRYFYPDAKERYSWWSYRENARMANRGWRIDYICVTQNLLDKVISTDILDQQMGSDHCPVVMEMKD